MSNFRIPYDMFEPINYNVKITTDMKKFIFNGEESISLNILKSTDTIILNIKELKIKSAEIISGKTILKPKIIIDKNSEQLKLKLNKNIIGSIIIRINFSGVNNDGMYGFYRSAYTSNNKTEYILSSQFENSDARAAFPCLDDPIFKSTFDITLIIDKNYDAISNMPISKITNITNGMKSVTFQRSLKMSTYLVYLGVGKFEYNESKYDEKPLRVVTVSGKSRYTDTALEYAKKFLSFYENYFGIKYQMPKLDLIAVPDFSAGAMENWGAITFREVSILTTKDSDMASKRRVAEVIAHEFVHQWFGDLVTMEWWDDIWLNESFAEFMSTKSIDKYYPEFRMGQSSYVENTLIAMSDDHLKDTRAIHSEVKSVADISSAFGGIIYQKGASILGMLEDLISPIVFRKGLQEYLKKYSYKNATRNNLWDSLSESARLSGIKINISHIMKDWITKKGYPLITVKRDGKRVILQQERFFLSKDCTDDDLWSIPIKYISSDGSINTIIMNKKEHILSLKNCTWIKLNYGQFGYYRVKYDSNMLTDIINAITSRKLKSSESIDIISNLFTDMRSGRLEIKTFVDISNQLFGIDKQSDIIILSYMRWLNSMVSREKLSNYNFNELDKKAALLFKKIGLYSKDNEDIFDTNLRANVLIYLSMSNYKPVISLLNKLFKKYKTNEKGMDSNLRKIIYMNAALNADKSVYNELFDKYTKQQLPAVRLQALSSMGMFKDKLLAKKALGLSLSKNVRKQDSYYVFGTMASNPYNKNILVDVIEDNWKKFMSLYEPGTLMLPFYVDVLATQDSADALKRITTFFSHKSNIRNDMKRAYNQTCELIKINIDFVKKNRMD